MDYIIETKSLYKRYHRHEVLKGVDIHIPKGSIYGLIGKNGAGKTTLMRIITGIQTPSSGEYSLFGVSCNDSGISSVRKRVGAVIESPSYCPEMTAEQNLRQQCRYLGIPDMNGIGDILETVGLSGTRKKKVKNFSFGMRQRLGIAMALTGSPDVIILDEPVNGLDPAGIIDIREMILKLNRERDITFLISSHILDELARIATHYGFMDGGRIVEDISSEEISRKCRRYYTFEMDNFDSAVRIAEEHGLDYKVGSGEIVVYGDFDLDMLLNRWRDAGCRIINISQTNESLENYYLNLIGGSGEGGEANDQSHAC